MRAKHRNRYLMLTVDTEALPSRATDDHVTRLMWGDHPNGSAGIREMSAVGQEFGARHVFFVDMCGAYDRLSEVQEVIRWLDNEGEDVQLHTHPEFLPEEFWRAYDMPAKPRFMNQYATDERADVVIQYFSKQMQAVTGKPVLAHRAGSFRWNAGSIRALAKAGILVSFNNSMRAMRNEQCVYSARTNLPFVWSNGVLEVPMTEKSVFPIFSQDQAFARLTYPESVYFHFRPWWGPLLFNTMSASEDFAVFLLHSWSLMYWDKDGHATYKDDRRIENYRKLLRRLSKDYDIITTQEFLDLHAQGKITLADEVDLSLAEYVSGSARRPRKRVKRTPSKAAASTSVR